VPGDAGEKAGEIAVVRMTATRRQRISILALTVVSGVAGLALIVVFAVTRPSADSDAGPVGASLLIVAVVCLYYGLAYAFGFTECSPYGIRTRGVFRSASCPWAEVAKITASFTRRRIRNRAPGVAGTAGVAKHVRYRQRWAVRAFRNKVPSRRRVAGLNSPRFFTRSPVPAG
jgi:hypothetical protein